MPTRHEAGWRKVLGRLTRPDEQLEAEEKRELEKQNFVQEELYIHGKVYSRSSSLTLTGIY